MDLKTPISLLQEYLVKEGTLPSYHYIHTGNPSHEPSFTYEVRANGLTAIGKGRSKKEAKHEAAKLMLLKLKGKTIWKEEIPIISHHVPSVIGNSVGALQEHCVQHCISIPQYELVSDEGNLTNHLFVFRCTVASYSVEGRASNKQQAKHLAAKAMLDKLGKVKEEINVMTSNCIKEKKELTVNACKKTIEAFQKSLHERQDRPYSSTNLTNLLNFADYFKNKIGPGSSALTSLKDIDEELIESHEDPEGLLNLIMNQLGFDFEFEFLSSKSSEYFLCNLVVRNLSINCMGSAKSKSDAMKRAAISTLKVLIVMYKS